jgi:hypothetical protein
MDHPLAWIVGLALSGFLLAAASFLLWHVLHAHARRDERRDERDWLRPDKDPKQ